MDVGVVDLGVRTRGPCLHLLVGGEAGLALGLARLLRAADPLQLALHLLGASGVLLGLHLEAPCLGLQIGGVVPLIGVERAAIDLADPLGDVVQEVAVVRDGQHGSLVVLQELLEPEHRLRVQMVGGLVQEQQVRRLEQELAEGHATPLAAREVTHGLVRVGALQGIHRLRELAVEVPAVGRVDLVLQVAHLGHERVEVRVGLAHLLAYPVEALDLCQEAAEGDLYVLPDRPALVQRRFLHEHAHAVARRKACLAVGDVLDAGHDLEQGRLAHAVGTHHADLGAREEAHGHVIQDDLVPVGLAHLVHLVNELRHVTPRVADGLSSRPSIVYSMR